MKVSPTQIYCPNLNCSAPLNNLGSFACKNCQTPLIYRYLWVAGELSVPPAVGSLVAGRYFVKTPQVWLDTQPALLPDFPTAELPDAILPYLHLYPQRLHVPEVYGVCPGSEGVDPSEVFLLENAPLDSSGLLFSAIARAWSQATAVRQVYWLWQMLQLWVPLTEQGVSTSLLIADNIRVEGWRVRLCQLFQDERVLPADAATPEQSPPPNLADLAHLWLEWLPEAKPAIVAPLQEICREMEAEGATAQAIAPRLNQLLLQQAAQLPLRLQATGASDTGPQYNHNEDACYPLNDAASLVDDEIFPKLAIVCDGIGGHEGGEVASQLAVQSIKLQVQAFLAEVAKQPEPFSSSMVADQLEAVVRVINNVIANQNDNQGREARQRMGTTLVMALQLPQPLQQPDGTVSANSHELYLVNIGDSRAYWITDRYCHRLTIDDDVAVREVRMGRSLYREALQRSDAGALTQALGTRDAEFLRPSIQRFVLEEDGILLLCSDGLSDYSRVEESWVEVMEGVLKGKSSLETAARSWIELANRKNGHDNASVVLLQCHVSTPLPAIALPLPERPATEWSESSRQLVQDTSQDEATVPAPTEATAKPRRSKLGWLVLGLAGLLLLGGLGFALWSQTHPASFQQLRERSLPKP